MCHYVRQHDFVVSNIVWDVSMCAFFSPTRVFKREGTKIISKSFMPGYRWMRLTLIFKRTTHQICNSNGARKVCIRGSTLTAAEDLVQILHLDLHLHFSILKI